MVNFCYSNRYLKLKSTLPRGLVLSFSARVASENKNCDKFYRKRVGTFLARSWTKFFFRVTKWRNFEEEPSVSNTSEHSCYINRFVSIYLRYYTLKNARAISFLVKPEIAQSYFELFTCWTTRRGRKENYITSCSFHETIKVRHRVHVTEGQ